MEPGSKKLPARFYETPAGNGPVRSWLLDLDAGDRQRVGIDIAKVEFGDRSACHIAVA